MADQEQYLSILKASYDYEPQSEDEVAVKEDQLLFLLEKTDDDWWKVRVKTGSSEDDGPSGLIPSAYVEEAQHTSIVKALYDYDAQAGGELSVKEDDVLLVYDTEDEWVLVQKQHEEGKIGFVPATYVEEVGAGEEAAPAPAPTPVHQIVIPEEAPAPPSNYVDPAERVAAARNAVQPDHVQTWPVSEIDKKGKKKKGTLGVGNGSLFFASEADKTPVQKWSTADVESVKIDKSKHVFIDIGGASPINLQFNAGSPGTAQEIIIKVESSRSIANPVASPTPSPALAPAVEEHPKTARASPSVHFATTPPQMIPPREPSEAGSVYEEPVAADGEPGIALYDFTADGEDELSVREGETLVVLERDGEEWWKCRNSSGAEGVVPGSYVELANGAAPIPRAAAASTAVESDEEEEEDDSAARAAEQAEVERREREERQRKERERAEKERKKREAERAKADAAAAEAERERKRKEKERKEKERAAEEEERRREEEKARRAPKKSEDRPRDSTSSSSSRPKDSKRGPPPERVRVWTDRSGAFRVDAAFLGYNNGKLRLHKTNGVVIEVPAEKMSSEDMRVVEKLMRKSNNSGSSRRESPPSDDDKPLAEKKKAMSQAPSRVTPAPKKTGPQIEWFEFFLNAGCDIDDCSRYQRLFEKDKIDEGVLADITEETMRRLGLREGDIIRVRKAIEARNPVPKDVQAHNAREEQIKRDEEIAKKLQSEVNGGKGRSSPAINLFAGPGGALKDQTRRGRPPPRGQTLPGSSVDINGLNTASESMVRASTPQVSSPATSAAVSPPPRSNSAAPAASGFDDDAWTNRPSSTKPSTPPVPRAPSAPPAPAAPPAPPAAAPAAPQPPAAPAVPAAVSPAASVGSGLAKTDDDLFRQLERLSQMRVQSPAVTSPPPAAPSPMAYAAPPAAYQNGMGMGNSPVPMGQHLQAQQTGMLSPPMNGPRGPFAPVPANQGLLQPLVPTTTGFTGMLPTRPTSTPMFQTPQQPSYMQTQPTGFNPGQSMQSQQTGFNPGMGLQSQPTGFNPGMGQPMQSQPTGFPGMGGSLMSQPTGFQMSQPTGFNPSGFGGAPSGPLASQPTGMPGGYGASGSMFQNGSNFGQLQPNPTGFNPGFGQFSNPAPPQPSKDVSPANVFAQMKAGTFENGESTPQGADKYDALRANSTPLMPQATGWGYQNSGFQGGYNGYR